MPSGTPLDLTTPAAEETLGDAIFRQCDAQPTGTGFINSFVRLQTPNHNTVVQQGYNTDARPLQFDENRSPQFTRSLALTEVPLLFSGTSAHRQFLLDINQNSSASLLSLDELRIYTARVPNLSGYAYNAVTGTYQLGGLDPIFDLDATGDYWLRLDYRLNTGSGSGDMFLLLDQRLFNEAPADTYVYFYSKFGENLGANAGFEEWAVLGRPAGELSSLSGFVYLDDGNGQRDAGEMGIEGVWITLNGIDSWGQTITLCVTTDCEGFYQFSNLPAGVYTLTETQPLGYEDGIDSIGSQGGQAADDLLFDIFLAAGVCGVNNNFGEELWGGS